MSELAQYRALASTSLVETLVNTRIACGALLLVSSVATSGCFFGSSTKKKAKVFTPPPVYSTAPAPPATPQPIVLTPPPTVDPEVDPGVDPVIAGTNLPPAPVKPTPVKPPPAKPPAVVVETPPAPVVAPAKPTTIFSTAERTRMNQEIDQSLGKVRTALAKVEGKNLSAELTTLANNARAQMMNAEQTRVQDLVTAVSLAKRAESFATELVQRLP